jgi:hypothetical protein
LLKAIELTIEQAGAPNRSEVLKALSLLNQG